ncbi:anoctamin-7-like isoform X1 [Dendronephthya gigantea]|uniref:anoctamin-7-like isoform X1 n=1 Tax=Dendronephthya gigantea TaxID=151771 RepID=UPI00106A77A8|nr:anoctamin-7-like isoform X1 [Dendronephthya gigantea]XP_028393644.1 anoctamin-7-like isoform X1 [Dendronephthya gigantea]
MFGNSEKDDKLLNENYNEIIEFLDEYYGKPQSTPKPVSRYRAGELSDDSQIYVKANKAQPVGTGHKKLIELVKSVPEANYGFNLKGGLDRPVIREDTGIFVTKIRPKGVAAKHGGLAPGDRILEINDRDCRFVKRQAALDLIQNSNEKLKLLVEKNAIQIRMRPKDLSGNIIEVSLSKSSSDSGLGFNVRGGVDHPHLSYDPGIFITTVKENSIASKDGRLQPGDKILEINGIDVRRVPRESVIDLINDSKKIVHLKLLKDALKNLIKENEEGSVDVRRGPVVVIELNKGTEGLGFNIRGGSDAPFLPGNPGIFVTNIRPGGVADRDRRLKRGDRILEINGVDVRDVSQETAGLLVQRNSGKISLLVEKEAEKYYKLSNQFKNNVDEDDLSGERGCFFKDGKRRTDFVLVYLEGDKPPPPRHAEFRQTFLENLAKSQIEFEEDVTQDRKTKVHFIKLHVPWEVLLFYAEELSFRAPLEVRDSKKINWSDRMMQKFHLPNIFKDEVPNQPDDYFTCEFQAAKLDKFIGSENPDTYFKDTERSRIVYEILETAPYGKKQRGEIGVERLVEEEVFVAAYPLHVGPYELPREFKDGPDSPEEIKLNQRQVLKEYWARWGKWLKYQPLDHIREYFGEKIGIYFAWLGQYTAWLLAPSFLGMLVFLYGVVTMHGPDNRPALEVCEYPEWTFKMCPLCDEDLGCKYWDLKMSCGTGRIAYLFDNASTVFYAVFVSFWAVFFLEFWKRKEITLAYHWDVLEYEEAAERPRPTFAALAPTVARNPVTGIMEPHFPEERRTHRVFSGIAVVLTMVSLVLVFMLGVIVYKLLVYRPLAKNPSTKAKAQQIANMTGAMVNLMTIMILSRVYEKVALALNHWEMHRTQTEYEDSLTFKVFCFQFVNFYSSIFYIAFFKGKMIGYPGNYNRLMGLRQEECAPGGCLMELAQQLVIIMIGKQLINNVQEVMIPVVKQWIARKKRGKSGDEIKPRWEQDYELIPNEGLFGEYLEMVLQFGFITIFVAAFPLAPFFALANNVFEIRIDSDKFVCEVRRPIADRAQDIGIWFNILDTVAKIAVISNAFLIAFTSSFLPKLLYRYSVSPTGSLDGYTNYSLAWAPANTTKEPCRYLQFRDNRGSHTAFYWHLLALKLGFVIMFEHFVFFVSAMIDLMVPDIPKDLDIVIKREAYLAKQALAEHQGGGITKSDESPDELDDDGV